MIVKIDSREHAGKNDHVINWFKNNGIEYISKVTLDTGDYMAHGNDLITVDRKQHLQEVYGNLVQDHERFRDECLRARRNGIKLVILVEEDWIRQLSEVPMWLNPRRRHWEKVKRAHQCGKSLNVKITDKPPLTSQELYVRMHVMKEKYGIDWQFTSKADCGARIVEILGGESGL